MIFFENVCCEGWMGWKSIGTLSYFFHFFIFLKKRENRHIIEIYSTHYIPHPFFNLYLLLNIGCTLKYFIVNLNLNHTNIIIYAITWLNISSVNYSIHVTFTVTPSIIQCHVFLNDMFEELLKSIRLEVICVIFPCDLPIFCN